MCIFAIPNQSSVLKVYMQFISEPKSSCILTSLNCDCLINYMEELVKYTIFIRPYFNLFGD